MNLHLPFWIKPSLGRTYGFNLYVADNVTGGILDAFLPNVLLDLQDSLNDQESMNITAKVSETVKEHIDPTISQRQDYNDYWQEKISQLNINDVVEADAVSSRHVGWRRQIFR